MKKFKIFAVFMLLLAFAVETSGQEKKLTGFIPQYEGLLNGKNYLRRNLTQQEIISYAEGLVKPKINPSNPHWNTQWKAYAEKLREQIVFGLRAETGRMLDWTEAKEIFLSLPTRKVVGEVNSTGVLTIPSQGGKVVGTGETRGRDPYKTSDGGEREVFGKKFRMSLVCGNTFMGIEYRPEPEPEEYEPPAPPKPKPPVTPPPAPPVPGVRNCPPGIKNCPSNGAGNVPGVNNGAGTGVVPGVNNTPGAQQGFMPAPPNYSAPQQVKQKRPAGEKAADVVGGLLFLGVAATQAAQPFMRR